MRALTIAPLAFVLGCNGVVELPPKKDAAGVYVVVDETGADSRLEVEGEDATVEDTDYPPFDAGPSDTWTWDGYDPGTDYLPAADSCDHTVATPGARPGSRFCEIYRDIVHVDGVAKCQSYACHGGKAPLVHHFPMGWSMKDAYDSWTTFKTWVAPPEPAMFVVAHPGSDSHDESAIVHFLFPVPTCVAPSCYPPMPLVDDRVHNSHLTRDQLLRISYWLTRGAPFD